MTRLNAKTRKSLLTDLLGHKFTPLLSTLIIDAKQVAEEIYESMFTPDTLKAINNLPEGWLPERPHMDVRVDYFKHNMTFDGLWIYWDAAPNGWGRVIPSLRDYATSTVSICLRMPHKQSESYEGYVLKDQDLINRFTDAREAQVNLNTQFGRARSQADVALQRFTTIENLIKEWPEIEPFAKKFIEDPGALSKIQLPAISTDVLNGLLDLPV
jgi:hypothetical protein